MKKLAINIGVLSIAIIGSAIAWAGWDTEACEAELRSCKANCQEGSIEYGNCLVNCQVELDACYKGLER